MPLKFIFFVVSDKKIHRTIIELKFIGSLTFWVI